MSDRAHGAGPEGKTFVMKWLVRFRFLTLLSMTFVTMTLVSVDFADARRGGSFGSRGFPTEQAVPPTRTAPNQTGPVERSTTPSAATRQPHTTGRQPRPGMLNGLGSGLMRGILMGGLVGMLLGYGFGGMAGVLGFLIQMLLIGALVWLAIAFFRSRSEPAVAGGAPTQAITSDPDRQPFKRDAVSRSASTQSSAGFTLIRIGDSVASAQPKTMDISLHQADLDIFERRLGEVQRAFAEEDHAALRHLSTPEMVAYFTEELADNAKSGMRNDVSNVRLIQADIAEAWKEGEEDYATAAFRYEAVDVLRNRDTGALSVGVEEPTEALELWTFVRKNSGEWKLSAIQEAYG